MSFDRALLPDPVAYYEAQGLKLTGPSRAKWKTTECRFHGGSDSMRINTQTGAFCCMAGCGARGGDVLAYEMATSGLEFIEAAKALGCWVENGKPQTITRPTTLSPRAALELLAIEVGVVLAAAAMARQGPLTPDNFDRLLTASARIQGVQREFA